MKALVTGSTGFLGGHIVDGLLARGHDVRCLVRNMDKAKRLTDLGLDVIVGDLRDAESLKRAAKGIDCVFHAAAKVSDWGPWAEFEQDTVQGTKNMLDAAISTDVGRFLYVSSVGVYDRKLLAANMASVKEDSPLTDGQGIELYSKAKALAESVVRHYGTGGNIDTTIIRPVTFYGPGDFPTVVRLMEFVRGPFAVWIGNYDPVLGMIYVTDVADICIMAASSDKAKNQIYNAALERGIKLREFMAVFCGQMGLSLPKRSIPYWVALVIANVAERSAVLLRRKSPPFFTIAELDFMTTLEEQASIAKAKHDLGWFPKVGLEEGVARTAEWAKSIVGEGRS